MIWALIFSSLVAIGVAYRSLRFKRAAPLTRPQGSPTPHSPEDDITLVVDRATLEGIPADDGAERIPLATPAAVASLPPDARPISRPQLGEAALEELLDDDVEPIAPLNHESRALLIYETEAIEDEPTAPVAQVLVWAQGDSDRGLRRARNEDAFLLLPQHSVFGVADGMGGYEGGQVASNLAVQAIERVFSALSDSRGQPLDPRLPRRGGEVAKAILAANEAVFEAARAGRRLARMGTTLVAARFALDKQRVYVGHVGDSRCYRLRGRELRQLTNDHTLEQLGFTGPGSKDLTRAIGIDRHIELDLVVDKPRVNDVYLLCSDGLVKMVNDDGIRDAILESEDLEAAVYGLIERANDAGGRDNVTVLLVKVLSAVDGLRALAAAER